MVNLETLRPFVAQRVPAAEVDDVLQDVFVRVQRGLPALRDEERLAPWLYQVARSAVRESARQRARHPLVNYETEELPGQEPEISVAEDTGLAAFAAAAVTGLPSPYREALTLTELQGMTQLAAAKLLGLSPSGMKSRVQRGREKLRQFIDSSCDIELDVRGGVVACVPKAQCSCTRREG